jgi:hypothetical protein
VVLELIKSDGHSAKGFPMIWWFLGGLAVYLLVLVFAVFPGFARVSDHGTVRRDR